MADAESIKVNKSDCCPLVGKHSTHGTVIKKAGALVNGNPGHMSPRGQHSIPPVGGWQETVHLTRVLKESPELSGGVEEGREDMAFLASFPSFDILNKRVPSSLGLSV